MFNAQCPTVRLSSWLAATCELVTWSRGVLRSVARYQLPTGSIGPDSSKSLYWLYYDFGTGVHRLHCDVSAVSIFLAAEGCGVFLFLHPDGSIPHSATRPFPRGVQYVSCGYLISSPPLVPPSSSFSLMSTSTSSTGVEMSSGYQVPSYFCLLKNFDSIYASGMFCHIAKLGRKRDQQLRLVWAVEQMLKELQKVREENLQLRSPFFHAKRCAPLSLWLSANCQADSSLSPLQISETKDLGAI